MIKQSYTFIEDNNTYNNIQSENIHQSTINGELFGYLSKNTASKEEIIAYQQGMFDESFGEKIQNSKPFGNFDIKTATKEEILAYCQGIIDQKVYQRIEQGQFQPKNQEKNSENTGNNHMQKGNALTKLPPGVKPGTFKEQSQYPSNLGFVNKLLITLLAGFGLGVIATAIYIFINLGKVSVHL